MKYDMSVPRKDNEAPTQSVKQLLAEFQNKLDDDKLFRKPPPPPAHRKAPIPPPADRKPLVSPQSPAQLFKNPNNFERSSSENGFARRSAGPKPKLAPKPLHLNGLIGSNSASEITCMEESQSQAETVHTPTILVSPALDKVLSSPSIEDENEEGEESNGVKENGVKNRAKYLEKIGFVPRVNLPAKIDRPVSEISTLSQVSDDFDDGDTTASEDESCSGTPSYGNAKELRRHRHEDDFDDFPLPRHERKNTVCTNTHSEIMHEMEKMGIVKGTSSSKKKNQEQQNLANRRKSNIDGHDIPEDIGKLRDNRKGRHNSLFVSSTSGISSVSDDTPSTILSDRSSTFTTISATGSELIVPDYYTNDEEENKRLKKLHYAAVEFLKVQSNYVQYLTEMAVLYPEYMERFGKRIGKDLLSTHNGMENVVTQIKKVLLQILPSHEMLLDEISKVVSNWDSEHPCMSKPINMYADFLKCCQPFLDHKAEFLNHLLALRNENKEFDEATYMFETEVFKRGKKGAVIQQLDQVHQNFMRYKLLMLRYSEYLVEGSEEKKRALETIQKLENVTQTVNQKMGLPTTEELTKLYYRYQCQFDVLAPGRKLIRQGDVLKQTRKEQQPRYLVLFSDCLWICRVSTSRSSYNQFEINKSYKIPLEGMRYEQPDNEEYANFLVIKSKVKSAVLIFSSEKERNQWMDDIQKASYDRKQYRRRQSEAIIKENENKKKLDRLMEDKKKNQNQIDEEEEEDEEIIERPSMLGTDDDRSRSTSSECGEGFSSVPDTPIDDGSDKFGSPIATTSGINSITNKKTSEVKPVWLPDNSSSECLMEGCSTEFSIINRRHHCRDCGWLICRDCKGQAPLSKYYFKKENVCPECFEKIHNLYIDGVLFPSTRLQTMSDGTYMVRVGKRSNAETVDARKLFKAPYNFRLRKKNIEEKRGISLVIGKVYLRNRKSEVVRHALLRKEDLRLIFYKAELDTKSVLEVLIYGYVYRETQLEGKNGVLFELVHRNQIRTDDTKDDVIAFRVDNCITAKKWSNAFQENLVMDPSSSSA